MTETQTPPAPPTVAGRNFDKAFLIERDGKSYILYGGLLDAAHGKGLKGITTELIQKPAPDNGDVAIVHAVAHMPEGDFSGYGDAGPLNVNRMMVTATIRMAETRAKARALRDAVNAQGELLDDQQVFGDVTAVAGQSRIDGSVVRRAPVPPPNAKTYGTPPANRPAGPRPVQPTPPAQPGPIQRAVQQAQQAESMSPEAFQEAAQDVRRDMSDVAARIKADHARSGEYDAEAEWRARGGR